jgi:hypothetical protein
MTGAGGQLVALGHRRAPLGDRGIALDDGRGMGRAALEKSVLNADHGCGNADR